MTITLTTERFVGAVTTVLMSIADKQVRLAFRICATALEMSVAAVCAYIQ